MKKMVATSLLFCLALAAFSQRQADKIHGIWINENKTMKIEFSGSETYSAKIVWMAEAKDKNGQPLLDAKNPNPALRKNALVGTVIIYGLQFENGLYKNGKIYAPRRGMIVNGSVRFLSDNKLEITGKKGLMSNSQIWTRA
ncbi:MAG: hypothetical protein BGN96_07250 [Bacteroidales bacterium 45-6]|nr:MAG: hypothetical protein BGN96_07250 [Bacteroidales bacterium 45-6]